MQVLIKESEFEELKSQINPTLFGLTFEMENRPEWRKHGFVGLLVGKITGMKVPVLLGDRFREIAEKKQRTLPEIVKDIENLYEGKEAGEDPVKI